MYSRYRTARSNIFLTTVHRKVCLMINKNIISSAMAPVWKRKDAAHSGDIFEGDISTFLLLNFLKFSTS